MHNKQARQAINDLMREVNLATEAIRSSASGIIRSIEQLPAEIGKQQQLEELLSRTPSEKNPILVFNPKSDNFYDFTIDDFTMIDYEPVKPQLSFELGV